MWFYVLLSLACAAGADAGQCTGPVVASTVLTTTPSDGITDIARSGGKVIVARQHSAVGLTDDDRMRSIVQYQDLRTFYPVCVWSEPPAGTLLLAQHSDSRTVLVLGDRGETIATLPASYAADLSTLETSAGPRIAIEVPRQKRIDFFDERGKRTGTAKLPFYISALRSEGQSLLVATYPDRNRGTTMYRVRADGIVDALHAIPAIGDFSLAGPGRYAIISTDGVEIRDREKGTVLVRIPAARAGRFRDIHMAPLTGGGYVTALSGRGGVDRHRLLWMAADGSLLYDREGPGHAHAVLAVNDCDVWVALDDSIERLGRGTDPQ